MKRRLSHPCAGIEIGASLDQGVYRFGVADFRRMVQWRLSVLVAGIDIRAGGQTPLDVRHGGILHKTPGIPSAAGDGLRLGGAGENQPAKRRKECLSQNDSPG
ncbi:MAG: hypothetical protein OXE80_03270 [Gammaproteobacteria bacterium]|nr:hypothetical protein [Gammaproteobacteria bacterium]